MEKDTVWYWGLLSLVLGIGYGSFFTVSAVPFFLLGAAVLLAVAIAFRAPMFFWFALFALCVCGGAQYAWAERMNFIRLPEITTPVTGVGRVVSDPEERDFYQKVLVRMEDCRSQACPRTDIVWQAPLSFVGRAGMKLSFACQLERPKNFTTDFDYPMFLAKDGIGYVCQRATQVESLTSDWQGRVWAAVYVPKHTLQAALSQVLIEPEAGLAKGLLLGGDYYLPGSLKEAFARVGLSHMIAVSGYNITIIAEMLLAAGLLIGLWRTQALWVAFAGIVLFILMIGLPASALRAGTMAGIVFGALQVGRLARPVRTLFVAGSLMVLVNPLLLRYDVGFQLSFLATLGILVCLPYYERFAPQQVLLKNIGEIVLMTVAVEIFVLPVILYTFHTVSPLIVIGNFLVLLVPVAMALAMVAAVLFLVLPSLSVPVAWVAYGVLWAITRSVDWLGTFTQMSVSVDNFGVWQLVYWYILLGVVSGALVQRHRLIRYAKNF